MLCAKSKRIGILTALTVISAIFVFSGFNPARAQQEPPTTIPAGGGLPADPNAIAFNHWLFYPTVNFLAENSDNFFMSSPQTRIAGWTFGVSPAMTAEWSNGIHSTTLYGNFQQLQYPTDNAIPQQSKITAPSGEATWTQQYAPLRDLNFTFVGDYSHQTIQSALTNSIPNPTTFTGTTTLPNGDIVLPNGTIITPTGQVVGQVGATPTASPLSAVNPYDAFTGTARVQKIFGYGGIVTLGASIYRADYEQNAAQDYTSKTFTEDGSFWLGPLFYGYSDGSFTVRDSSALSPDSTANRIIGGIGTRQFGLWRASIYFGHQGSGTSGSASAGGNVYGGRLTYYATPLWTLSANVDDTINLAPAGAPPSSQALSVPGISPLQIPLSSSTQVTSTTFMSNYVISPQWTTTGTFGFTHVENIGSPIWNDAYFADANIKYDIWRNLTLTWDYQYSSITSNAPFSNVKRNMVVMSATYKF